MITELVCRVDILQKITCFFSPTVRNGCNLTPFLFTRKKRQICSRSHYTGTLYILIIYIIYIKMDLRRKKKPKQKKKLLFSTGIQIRRFRLLSKLEGSPFYIFVFTLSLSFTGNWVVRRITKNTTRIWGASK